MELRLLRYFVVIAQTLNISEASRRLHVSQPSLSRQIRDLEAEVGHPLFDRHKGRLSLTASGRALRNGAQRIIRQVEEMLAQSRAKGTTHIPQLRVAYYGMMWATVIASALSQFRRLFPNTAVTFVELSPAQIVDDLKKGTLDVAVLGHGPADRSRKFVDVKIASVEALIALSTENPLSKRRIISLAELKQETFLSYAPEYAPGRDASFLRACRVARFKPKLVREASGLPALLLAVAENRGIAVVSPFAPRAPHPGVVFARLRPPGVRFDISVAYRTGLPSAGRRLAELIAEVSRRDLLKQP